MPHLSKPTYSSDTALVRSDEGLFQATLPDHWLVGRGAHGGFLAGLTIRAMRSAAPDQRPLRSFTMHFMRPPTPGPIVIAPTIERAGRSTIFQSVRVLQDRHLVATALGAMSRPFADLVYEAAPMPEVPDPEEVDPAPKGTGPSFLDNFDLRWCIGDMILSGSDRAIVGGWLRTDPPEIATAETIATFMDTYPPAIFPLLSSEPLIAPTLDLTIHLRAEFPLPEATTDDFYLGEFRTSVARDGFFEEDGRLWSRDGVLLAQSRQLALLLKPGD